MCAVGSKKDTSQCLASVSQNVGKDYLGCEMENMNRIRFSHIALNCQDPIQIEAFYAKHFGFERTRVYDPGEHEVVMIRLGECYIELFPAQQERPLPPQRKMAIALLECATSVLKWMIWIPFWRVWVTRQSYRLGL